MRLFQCHIKRPWPWSKKEIVEVIAVDHFLSYDGECVFYDARCQRISTILGVKRVTWKPIPNPSTMTPEEAAKLSERKTMHEWLNDLGIPRKEGDRDLCLLRRVRVLCDQTYSLRSELARSKGTIEGMEIGLSLTNAHDT